MDYYDLLLAKKMSGGGGGGGKEQYNIIIGVKCDYDWELCVCKLHRP